MRRQRVNDAHAVGSKATGAAGERRRRGARASRGAAGTPEDPSWRYVDLNDVHYNANGQGYAQMHAANPGKAMTHNETFPATIHQDVTFAGENVWATGTWIWAAWDHPGECGFGKTAIPAEGTAETIGDQSVMPGRSVHGVRAAAAGRVRSVI